MENVNVQNAETHSISPGALVIHVDIDQNNMKGNCTICGEEIEIQMCCSGQGCGCMGLPVEMPVCSEECEIEYRRIIREKRGTFHQTPGKSI